MKPPDPKELERRFWEWPPVKALVDWSRRRSFPGFFKVPIYDVIVFVLREIQRFDLFTRANSIAYSFFLSLFPSIMALFTLAPFLLQLFANYIPELNDFNDIIREELQRVMPGQAGDFVFDFIHDITNEPRIGLLSFGFILALYFSSNGMLAMMQSFEKSYRYGETFRKRNALRKRLVAVGLTGLIGGLVVFAVVFIILGSIFVNWISDLIHLTHLATFGLTVLRWMAILIIFYFGIAALYRYGSATHRRFSWFSPGATLATTLSILSSLAFSFYIDEFNRYDTYSKFYGSIGTIIIMMLWIQLNCLILLIGFELNASIAVNRDLKAAREED
ncbi:MAG: YihY/virulence factor BrkB family protein [Lewinella sp.]|nr:YihY/virulence factor BrkB family protein [Lewinella sp.]